MCTGSRHLSLGAGGDNTDGGMSKAAVEASKERGGLRPAENRMFPTKGL